MRYLILGGCGFIGSNLSKYLINSSQYNEIEIVDNLQTGSLSNIEDIWDQHYNERLKFHKIDITDQYFLEKYGQYKEDHINVVFNLACPASPVHYQSDPYGTVLTCTQGTTNALEIASITRARYFQASTSEVYGNPSVHPQPESYWGNVNPYGPRACYDEGKRVGETLCYIFKDMVDIRIGRIFNTYGPNMAINDGRVVSNLIVQALRGESLTICGSGNQTRSMCYIDDLIQAILTLMISNTKTPVNLGNPQEITMNELAEKILTITKSTSNIVYQPLPEDDPERRRPDISAINELGWSPKVSLDEGLEKTVHYFRSRLNG